jgi:hypothetical protein
VHPGPTGRHIYPLILTHLYFPVESKDRAKLSFNITLQLTHFEKNEQIMRILSAPTLIRDPQSQETCICDIKEEMAEQNRNMFDQMQDGLRHIESSFGMRQQKTEQTLWSF